MSRQLLGRKTGRGAVGFVLIAVLLLLFVPAVVAQQEDAPADVMQAAQDGLIPFLNAIPDQDLGHFNFAKGDILEEAALGEPFRVYTIMPEKILNYSAETNVLDILSPAPLWYFPVVLGDEVRTLLKVGMMGGEWKAVGIGSSELAQEWASLVKGLPPSDGCTFVRVFQARADFALVRGTGDAKMLLLKSAAIALGLNKGGAYSPSDVIMMLQGPVMDNIEMFETE